MTSNETMIAHVREKDMAIQTLDEHLNGVAKLCRTFTDEFFMGDWGELTGLLHDKGKERKEFQEYIRKVSGLDPDSAWHGEDKRHAYIGAVLAKMIGGYHQMISYPIMGHHAGLYDYPDFERIITERIPDNIKTSGLSLPRIPEAFSSRIKDKDTLIVGMHHLIRMLFSCLVDADYLDTEAFINAEQSKLRRKKESLSSLAPHLDEYIATLKKNSDSTQLNDLRSQIQQRCKDHSTKGTGIYSLTVPTGGGKTLSSLVWAINHALKNGKKRIIIAIPYTSIVTQTAQILSGIFGKENVLEHHSNHEDDQAKDDELRLTMKLATENWDYPIVVTTNVQLFESLMSNKPSKCRKLHNLANSVLILDEIQTLPLEYLQPIIDTLQTYNRLFGTTILFTTASMPALLGDICWGKGANKSLRGIKEIEEIIPKGWNLYDKLRRTRIVKDSSAISCTELASRLSSHERVLCIVNTRRDAKELFESLPEQGIRIHLSRMMCSSHLRKAINQLKADLLKETNTTIRVVATQLIEAGVDIDFPVVYRQEAGLDSVLQAAGRCNREGKRGISDVFVFRLNKKPFGSIGRASDAWADLRTDCFAPQTMNDYFINLYSRTECFDKADFKNLLYRNREWRFQEASNRFKMIDDSAAYSVIVNYEDSPGLIERLKKEGPSYTLIKALNQYSVSIHKKDFEEFRKMGLIEEIIDGFYFVPDSAQYREDIGLSLENHWLEEILTI